MELWSRVFLTFAFIAAAAAQSKSSNRRPAPSRPATTTQQTAGALTDECPEPNGYFADGYQCDKYYVCTDGVITEKLCPDGMVFNDYNPSVEKCDLPFNIDCSQRPERQTPKPSQHCPRQNGYFAHEDGHICDKFYYCVDGKYNAITCPAGLVYNENTGICTWPDEAKKKHCSSQEVFQFSCPNVSTTEAQQHPRYADPQDCQYFYVCINGEIPRRNGCKMGQVFNDASKACDWPRNVPECVDWYKGVLTDEELEALEHPKPKPRPTGGTPTRGKTKGKSSRPAAVEDLPVEPDVLIFARNSRPSEN
nr:PREDICTED: probable chitinase 3 [Bemisia tabaci]